MTFMARQKPKPPADGKAKALRAHSSLHPHPERVRDEAFLSDEFFDPRDHVQVKYEMLRRHRLDEQSVTQVSAAFGFSRQAFYVAENAFQAGGIAELLPQPRGPKRAHKCTDELLDFVLQWRQQNPTADNESLVEEIHRRFHITIHPRTIDRALARRKKKTIMKQAPLEPAYATEQYESLRREAIGLAWTGVEVMDWCYS
jgi:transposase